MRNGKLWMMSAILALSGATMTGCRHHTRDIPAGEEVTVEEDNYLSAIDRYLTDEIAKQYEQGDVCIPCPIIVDVNDSQSDSVLVWGDFWVYNYELKADTLKTVSAGSHPGLMHVRKTATGYEVYAFDAVADGSEFAASARKIFGDRFDGLQEVMGNEKTRNESRLRATADYVTANGIEAKMYKDHGWPPVTLPLK